MEGGGVQTSSIKRHYTVYHRGHRHGGREHQKARKDPVSRLLACSKTAQFHKFLNNTARTENAHLHRVLKALLSEVPQRSSLSFADLLRLFKRHLSFPFSVSKVSYCYCVVNPLSTTSSPFTLRDVDSQFHTRPGIGTTLFSNKKTK